MGRNPLIELSLVVQRNGITSVRGYDEAHVGVLSDKSVIAQVNEILDAHR